MATRVSPGDDSNLLYVPLLKEEDARYAANTGISSANFYEGDVERVHEELKSRLKDVLRANPWIAGVVKPLSKAPKRTRRQIRKNDDLKGKIGKSVLVFSKSIADEDIDDVVGSLLMLEEEIDPQLQRSSTYRQLAEACQCISRVVPNRAGLYRSGQNVTKITLVPTSNDEFCVVFAMSHLIADGDTYFKILTMLSTKKEGNGVPEEPLDGETFVFDVDELDPKREYEYREIEQAAIGMEQWEFMSSLKFIKMMVQGLRTKPKKQREDCPGSVEPNGLRIRANFIDKTKINTRKRMYQERLKEGGVDNNFGRLSGLVLVTEDVEFISTHDIITSAWFNASSSRLPMFTFNLRERCPKLSKNLAGNYETSMVLDPPSYSYPSFIRKCLQPKKGRFKRAYPRPLPKEFWERTSCAFLTTWCFSVDEKPAGLHLHGCRQLLHMPVMPVSILKTCPMDFAVVFNANIDIGDDDKTRRQAILMFCKEATDDVLMNNADSVLGDGVNALGIEASVRELQPGSDVGEEHPQPKKKTFLARFWPGAVGGSVFVGGSF